LFIEIEGAAAYAPEAKEMLQSLPRPPKAKAASTSGRLLLVIEKFLYHDIGWRNDVESLNLCCRRDMVEEGDSIIVLGTDKASMDILPVLPVKVGKISINWRYCFGRCLILFKWLLLNLACLLLSAEAHSNRTAQWPQHL